MEEMNRMFVILVFILFIELQSVRSFAKFTNIECESFDKPFADFSQCKLKVPKRGEIALHLHVNLYKVPVNNVSINLSLHKKMNGFRPFMYNLSANFCEYMANQRRFPFMKIFFDVLLRKSNINHTCPYDHDIIVNGLILKDYMFQRLPLPDGTYMFKLMVGAYNDWKAVVRAYILRQE